MPNTPQKIQFGFAVGFGIAGLAIVLLIAIFIPVPTLFQYQVFRIILALAAGGAASMIPGILNVQIPNFPTITPTLTPVHLYSTKLQVPATSDWTPPIAIPDKYDNRTIAKVTITASGSWSGDAHGGNYNGPGGNGARAAANFALPGISEWCLLVRLNVGPLMFFRTDSDQIEVTPPCTLSFRINDSSKLDDNGGFMDVKINEVK